MLPFKTLDKSCIEGILINERVLITTKFDVLLTLFLLKMGVVNKKRVSDIVLGSFWDCFGVVLGLFWDRFAFVLESLWNSIGFVLGSFCYPFVVMALFWVILGIVLGSF